MEKQVRNRVYESLNVTFLYNTLVSPEQDDRKNHHKIISTRVQFCTNLIKLNFFSKALGMLKDEFIVYLCMYLNISGIC